jgi:hypothetical protein
MLEKYPQIAELLVPDKPYTLIIASLVITFCMTVTYFVRVRVSLKFRMPVGQFTCLFFTL